MGIGDSAMANKLEINRDSLETHKSLLAMALEGHSLSPVQQQAIDDMMESVATSYYEQGLTAGMTGLVERFKKSSQG